MAHLITAQTCDEAWRQAVDLVRAYGVVENSRHFRKGQGRTKEVLHVSINVLDPLQRIVFSRPINPAFAMAEVIWIMAGSNSLDFILPWNKTMAEFSDDGHALRGAYGFRLGSNVLDTRAVARLNLKKPMRDDPTSAFKGDQLHAALMALSDTPDSRQVVLQIWDSILDFPGNGRSGAPRSKDIPCNLMSHLLLRDGKLHWMQVMRSNDLVWGTPYNFIQWTSIQQIMAGWLGVEVGEFTLQVGSLHVYDHHWDELDSFNWDELEKSKAADYPVNTAPLSGNNYYVWGEAFKELVYAVRNLTTAINRADVDVIDLSFDRVLARLYANSGADVSWLSEFKRIFALLRVERLRQLGCDGLESQIALAGPYYAESWENWYEHLKAAKIAREEASNERVNIPG